MPIATLKFNLPEEREEWETTQKAGAMSSTLWDIDNELLRGNSKHGPTEDLLRRVLDNVSDEVKSTSPELRREIVEATVYAIREMFWEIMNTHEVSLG